MTLHLTEDTGAIDIALGETLNGPQLVLENTDATGWTARMAVAATRGATPVLDMSTADGTLVIETTWDTAGVPTATITPNVDAATVAGLAPGNYVYDCFATDSLGSDVQLIASTFVLRRSVTGA